MPPQEKLSETKMLWFFITLNVQYNPKFQPTQPGIRYYFNLPDAYFRLSDPRRTLPDPNKFIQDKLLKIRSLNLASMSNSLETRYCRQFEKQLYGRADQMYCNDTCRNIFNKYKEKQAKTPPHPKEQEIFAIIRRNYDILKRITPKGIYPGHEFTKSLDNLPAQFNKNFFTGMIETKEETWYLCFNRGWREEGRAIVMKDFPEKLL